MSTGYYRKSSVVGRMTCPEEQMFAQTPRNNMMDSSMKTQHLTPTNFLCTALHTQVPDKKKQVSDNKV